MGIKEHEGDLDVSGRTATAGYARTRANWFHKDVVEDAAQVAHEVLALDAEVVGEDELVFAQSAVVACEGEGEVEVRAADFALHVHDLPLQPGGQVVPARRRELARASVALT